MIEGITFAYYFTLLKLRTLATPKAKNFEPLTAPLTCCGCCWGDLGSSLSRDELINMSGTYHGIIACTTSAPLSLLILLLSHTECRLKRPSNLLWTPVYALGSTQSRPVPPRLFHLPNLANVPKRKTGIYA